jgi:hypothetical protein
MVCHLLTPGLELWQYSEKAVGAGEQDAGSSDSPKKDTRDITRSIDPGISGYGHVLNFKEHQYS